MLVWIALVLGACNPSHKTDTSPSSPVTETDTPPTGDTEETGDTEDTDTEDTSETDTDDPAADWPGWEVVDTDTTSFAEWDYEVRTYEIGAEWPNAYDTMLGTPRRFYLLAPVDASGAIPVIASFHGGAVDDDSDPAYYTTGDPYETKCGVAADVSAAFVTPEHTLMPYLAATRGWAMVFPENLWCDFWSGRGDADPVDPLHRSYEHVAEILDFLEDGGPGFSASELYGWGSSSGGAGAMIAAAWYDGFGGVIADSAPCDMVTYFPDDPRAMEHIFGGPPLEADGKTPTGAYPNYLAASCTEFVANGFTVPVYVPWNNRDILTNPNNPSALVGALQAHYTPSGVRWGSHDFDHNAPGTTFHAQSRQTPPPFPYVTELMFRFLEGADLVWNEAEHGCQSGCTVGATLTNEPAPPWSTYSLGGGRIAEPPGGVGVMWQAGLPGSLPGGVAMDAVALIVAEAGALSDSDVVARIVYSESGIDQASVDLTGATFAVSHNPPSDAAEMVTMVQGNKLSFTPTDPGAGQLRIETTGIATLRLDAIVFAVP